jgi:hypothetical protein
MPTLARPQARRVAAVDNARKSQRLAAVALGLASNELSAADRSDV